VGVCPVGTAQDTMFYGSPQGVMWQLVEAPQEKRTRMNLGKLIRLNRLFAHPSRRLCSVAVDHFIGYGQGLPDGLRRVQPTLAAVVAGRPDAVTLHKGLATAAWPPHAGVVPLILQSSAIRPDDTAREQLATPEDAVRLGADAIAVAAFVRGATEGAYLRVVADWVREAAKFDLPVICHTYPRDPATGKIVFGPEDIAWAVRCAVEVGVDVVKTPYCGDVSAFAQIVSDCPLPVVAAGGPQAGSLPAALAMMAEVVRAGARGATIGRNVWGFEQITAAVHAFKAVIHDGQTAEAAIAVAGLATK
jgi:fructose-bisphosphate aldolase, class I